MGEVNTVVLNSPPTGPDKPAAEPVKDPNRPAWLPEKFKTAEDLAKSYTELEKRVGSKPADPPPVEKKAEDGLAPVEKKPETPPQPTPADFDKYSEAFTKNGKLSDAEYGEIQAKYNVPKALVDEFIQNRQTAAQSASNDLLSTVGGPDGYGKLTEWAGANLDQASIDAFNSTLATRDTAKIKLALQGLKAQYDTENGVEPNLIGGDGKRTTTTSGFRSIGEQTAAIRDPRYRTDAAFRKDVQDRIAVSQY